MSVKLCRRLLKIRPKSPQDLVVNGFKLKRLGSGAFRETYEIKGYGAVIKFPIPPKYPTDSNLHHAQAEIKILRKIHTQAKYKAIRSVVPELYYSDLINGIIAVKKYDKIGENAARGAAKAISAVFDQLFDKETPLDEAIDYGNESDIEPYNIMGEYKTITTWDGKKKKVLQHVVLIDLGLV